MQVKKFEAKSMKEALDLVKTHLGPEAIILSARDSHRGFGLMGDKSVEVTAAVSEETLRRKKLAESKMREDLKQQFNQIPASKQREFINRVFDQTREEKRELVSANSQAISNMSPEVRQQLRGMRYIDIADDDSLASKAENSPKNSPNYTANYSPKAVSRDRVRRAAEMARQASQSILNAQQEMESVKKPTGRLPAQTSAPTFSEPTEVQALEHQVKELRQLIESFQKVPQIQMSMHPGAEQGLPYELSGAYQRLTGEGVSPSLTTQILKKANKELDPEILKKPALIDAWVVRHLLNTVTVNPQPTLGRYHVFMGSTGQGKTTTLVKLASHLILKEKRTIAIVGLDTLKLGAAEQLRIYAQILNVPFAVVRSPEEWRVAEARLGHIQHILVDCPGLSLKNMEEADWLRQMIPPREVDRRLHFVQSILARDEETFEIASRYQMLSFDDVIFTRLDESSRQGLLLNFQDRFKTPLHSFGWGTRVPEDYEFASKERVIDLLFKLSRVSKREDRP